MSESQINYLFTLKNAHLSSNSYNFRMQPNILMKFAVYMAWILLCKHCKFGEKNSLQFRRYQICPRGLLFLARPVHASNSCSTVLPQSHSTWRALTHTPSPFASRHGHGASECILLCAYVYPRALAGTHCIYPLRDGQAELTWMAGYIPRWFTSQQMVN